MRNSGPYDSPTTDEPPAETLYCANHPTVPTYLRCGRCDKPICARCRVATPVGYRCYDCARLTVLPTYAVDSRYYARAVPAGFAFATVAGLLWALLPGFDFWMALLLGIGVGEVVSRAANLKRGPGLQAVGLAAGVWGLLLSRAGLALMLTNPGLRNFIYLFPGNGSAPLLRGGGTLAGLAQGGDFPALLTTLAGQSVTDILGLAFLLLALGLIFLRLR